MSRHKTETKRSVTYPYIVYQEPKFQDRLNLHSLPPLWNFLSNYWVQNFCSLWFPWNDYGLMITLWLKFTVVTSHILCGPSYTEKNRSILLNNWVLQLSPEQQLHLLNAWIIYFEWKFILESIYYLTQIKNLYFDS